MPRSSPNIFVWNTKENTIESMVHIHSYFLNYRVLTKFKRNNVLCLIWSSLS